VIGAIRVLETVTYAGLKGLYVAVTDAAALPEAQFASMKTLIILALAMLARSAEAQTYWRYSSAVSGATWGATYGIFIDEAQYFSCSFTIFEAPDPGCRHRPELPIGLAAALGLLGFKYGWDADVALARGESLSDWKRFRLQSQLVLTPPLLALWATARIEPEGTRQNAAWIAAGGGLMAGLIMRKQFERALHPAWRASIAPTRNGVAISFTSAR
jgi:hypothetical protein